MKNKTGKRLTKKKWDEIKLLLIKPNRNISKIAIRYGVNRATIYQYAWRRGWMRKKRKPKKENVIKRMYLEWKK